jgi:hypothetical protein
MVCPGPMFIVSSCTQGSRGHDTLGRQTKRKEQLPKPKHKIELSKEGLDEK